MQTFHTHTMKHQILNLRVEKAAFTTEKNNNL